MPLITMTDIKKFLIGQIIPIEKEILKAIAEDNFYDGFETLEVQYRAFLKVWYVITDEVYKGGDNSDRRKDTKSIPWNRFKKGKSYS